MRLGPDHKRSHPTRAFQNSPSVRVPMTGPSGDSEPSQPEVPPFGRSASERTYAIPSSPHRLAATYRWSRMSTSYVGPLGKSGDCKLRWEFPNRPFVKGHPLGDAAPAACVMFKNCHFVFVCMWQRIIPHGFSRIGISLPQMPI